MAETYSAETKILIEKAKALSEHLQLLINSDTRQFIVRNNRDPLALMYWNIVFEHHQGLLLLLKHLYPAPAFALLRVVQEASFRSFLVMFGTEKQVAAIKAGTYQMDFKAVGEQIDQKLQIGPLVQPRMQLTTKALHDFTHSGPQQLLRQFSRVGADEVDIASSYADDEINGLVSEATVAIGLTTMFTTEYFDLPLENTIGIELVGNFVSGIKPHPPIARTTR